MRSEHALLTIQPPGTDVHGVRGPKGSRAMSELKRLLDDPSRVPLRSRPARVPRSDDGPPPRSLERTLAALGVAGAVAAIGAEAVGAAAVGGAAEAAVGAAGR